MAGRQLIPGECLAPLNISVRADQKAALEALARDNEQSVSHECRRAIDAYLARYGRLGARVPVPA